MLDEGDATAFRYEREMDPDILDLEDRYWQVLAQAGNDLTIGPRLAAHVEDAGFEVLERRGRYDHYPLVPGIRPVAWAGRQAILDAGLCTEDDIVRWEDALRRREEAGGGGWIAVTNFAVLARKP